MKYLLSLSWRNVTVFHTTQGSTGRGCVFVPDFQVFVLLLLLFSLLLLSLASDEHLFVVGWSEGRLVLVEVALTAESSSLSSVNASLVRGATLHDSNTAATRV